MSTFLSNVQPRRRVKQIRKEAWECSCRKKNPYFWTKCPSCGDKRPN